MLPVASTAIPAVVTLKRSRIPGILAVAFETPAMLTASTRRIILASLRFRLADLAVFFIRDRSHSVHHSGYLSNGRQPAGQEEMMAAKGASIREEKPLQCPLYGVSDADASKVDGPAMRAARVKHDLGNLI